MWMLVAAVAVSPLIDPVTFTREFPTKQACDVERKAVMKQYAHLSAYAKCQEVVIMDYSKVLKRPDPAETNARMCDFYKRTGRDHAYREAKCDE